MTLHEIPSHLIFVSNMINHVIISVLCLWLELNTIGVGKRENGKPRIENDGVIIIFLIILVVLEKTQRKERDKVFSPWGPHKVSSLQNIQKTDDFTFSLNQIFFLYTK